MGSTKYSPDFKKSISRNFYLKKLIFFCNNKNFVKSKLPISLYVSYHFFGARDTYLFITNNHRIRIKNSNFCCKRSRNCPQCDNHETSYREVAIELYRIHVVVWTIFTYLYSIPYIYIFQYWTHFLMYEK